MANSRASDLIEAALNEVLLDLEDAEEGDILVEWALVAYVTNPVEEKGDSYALFYSNGNMPSHRAQGLFMKGMNSVGVDDDDS